MIGLSLSLTRQQGGPTVPPGSTIALGFDSGSLLNAGSLGGSALYSANSGLHWGRDGVVQGHNLFLNSATGATQSITLVAAEHTLSFKGTGSVAIGGTGSGSLAGTGASDRVSLAFTPTAGSVSFTVTGSITEVVVCRGAYQSYIPTTSAAVYLPRVETSGASGGCVFGPEMSGTNLLTYSQDFSNAAWNKYSGSVTVTPNATIAPDGTLTGSLATTITGVWLLYEDYTFPVNAPYIFSVWVKAATAGSKNKFRLYISGTTVSTDLTATSEWQRFTVACAAPRYTGAPDNNGLTRDSTNSAAELYIWGAQLEAGSIATTYIPTLAATVTRPQEDLSVTGGAAFGAAAGTVSGWVNVLTGSPWLNTTSSPWLFGLVSASTNNMVGLYKSTNTIVAKTTNASGTASTHSVTTTLSTGWHHLALTYDATALTLYIDGVAQASPTATPNIPSTIGTTAYIGADYAKSSASQVNAPIDSIHTYPTALTAAQITALYRTRK